MVVWWLYMVARQQLSQGYSIPEKIQTRGSLQHVICRCMEERACGNSSGQLKKNNLSNLYEIFRKDVSYDNIKSHIKPGFHPLCKRYIFRKTKRRVKLTPPPLPPPNRFRDKGFKNSKNFRGFFQKSISSIPLVGIFLEQPKFTTQQKSFVKSHFSTFVIKQYGNSRTLR